MDSLEKARRVISLEIEELNRLVARIDESFVAAVEMLKATVTGGAKIIIVGVGTTPLPLRQGSRLLGGVNRLQMGARNYEPVVGARRMQRLTGGSRCGAGSNRPEARATGLSEASGWGGSE